MRPRRHLSQVLEGAQLRIWACAFLWAVLIAVLASAAQGQSARNPKPPRLPGGILLSGWPPFDLTLASDARTITLQQEQGDGWIVPSMTRDGRVVASAHIKPGQSAGRPLMVVGTFSLETRSWTYYEELLIYGCAVAITADGSRIAALVSPSIGATAQLRMIEPKSGKLMDGPESNGYASLSWSPDGKSIAFDLDADTNRPPRPDRKTINIFNLETQTTKKVAEGQSPAWSPSGEWIAYLKYGTKKEEGPNILMLVHPDGTEERVLWVLGKSHFVGPIPMIAALERFFTGPPVWSPDSTKLILNEIVDDEGHYDVHLWDLTTGQHKRIAHKTAPVFGWAVQK